MRIATDIIADAAEDDNWQAETRVRSQGQEHDVIVNKGRDYFVLSSKWEREPVEPKEVELLESRVRSRAGMSGGLLVSMSGFTANCIEEARFKISSAPIYLFGPADVEALMKNDVQFSELLDAKTEQALKHRRILVDGEAR